MPSLTEAIFPHGACFSRTEMVDRVPKCARAQAHLATAAYSVIGGLGSNVGEFAALFSGEPQAWKMAAAAMKMSSCQASLAIVPIEFQTSFGAAPSDKADRGRY